VSEFSVPVTFFAGEKVKGNAGVKMMGQRFTLRIQLFYKELREEKETVIV
jgi:hypothetical protein